MSINKSCVWCVTHALIWSDDEDVSIQQRDKQKHTTWINVNEYL